ncbi:MAG: queuosine precursor transporter [Spirochaetaceae bacterium]|jgi:uncharacterized integral membrane protein (TIGR00697 family)|nr:queuosine precursor transporter [Spirochaetaceae bacterium]
MKTGGGDFKKSFRYLDVITASFTACLIISNVASSAKIVSLGVSLFGTPLVFDGGTLLFPISYIFGDILTEVYGFKASRRVIWIGFAGLSLSSAFFFLLGLAPGESEWLSYAGEGAYGAILGGISSGGIVIASLAGYFAGEFSNSVLLSRLKVIMNGRFLFVRAIGSTLIGEFLDTLIFVSIACLAGVFSPSVFVSLLFTNYILKCAVEAALTPVTCFVCARLKSAENSDAYDRGVRYMPV